MLYKQQRKHGFCVIFLTKSEMTGREQQKPGVAMWILKILIEENHT